MHMICHGLASTLVTPTLPANQYNALFPPILIDMISRGATVEQAWGKLLGTILVCVWFEALISIMPPRVIKRLFPTFVLGVTVFLIGVQLTTAGMRFWGGGTACSLNSSILCGGNGQVRILEETDKVASGNSKQPIDYACVIRLHNCNLHACMPSTLRSLPACRACGGLHSFSYLTDRASKARGS